MFLILGVVLLTHQLKQNYLVSSAGLQKSNELSKQKKKEKKKKAKSLRVSVSAVCCRATFLEVGER